MMPVRGSHTIDPQQARRELGITEGQQRLEQLVVDVYGHEPVWTPRRQSFRPWNECDRCGVKTRRRGLCRDCQDVTM